MFGNTFTINVLDSDRTLTRINQDKLSSQYRYRGTDIALEMNIRHTDRPTPGKIGIRTERHNVELTATVFSTDAGITTSSAQKAYLVFEVESGQDATVAKTMLTFITSNFVGTAAAFTGLANFES